MKILFIGDLNEYGRSFQRCRTFREMGHSVTALSHTPVPFRPGIDDDHGLWFRLRWRIGWPIDSTSINRKALEALGNGSFDVVWVEKCLTIRPETLERIKGLKPGPKLVWCSEDDMAARWNQSVFFKRGLTWYDVVFTTKVYNLEELKALGARRTELFLDTYDEKVHRPLALSEEDTKQYGCDIAFVGMFERERAEQMLYLAEHGITVTVWGNGWKEWVGRNPNLIVKNRPILGDDYVKVVNAAKINLCFLRKINRDEVTSRSVEIPACGAFMIAERTKRHLEFFEEGKEAVFFATKEELIEKVGYYLKNDGARRKIAAAGRERCVRSGYSTRAQLTGMLEKI